MALPNYLVLAVTVLLNYSTIVMVARSWTQGFGFGATNRVFLAATSVDQFFLALHQPSFCRIMDSSSATLAELANVAPCAPSAPSLKRKRGSCCWHSLPLVEIGSQCRTCRLASLLTPDLHIPPQWIEPGKIKTLLRLLFLVQKV